MITKGYLCYLVHVKDSNSKSPSLQSIPMVNEFPKVFPDDIPRISLDRGIDFGIDLYRIPVLSLFLLIEFL